MSSTQEIPPAVPQGSRTSIRWSQGKLLELRRQAQGERQDPVAMMLLQAQIMAAEGDFELAEANVFAALKYAKPEYFRDLVHFHTLAAALVVIQRLDVLGEALRERFQLPCAVFLAIEDLGSARSGPLRWEVNLPESLRLTVDASILQTDETHDQVIRLCGIFPLFANYAKHGPGDNGTVVFNEADEPLAPGLAMYGNPETCFLVPDHAFLSTEGYQETRAAFGPTATPWRERRSIAFWRGATAGRPSGEAKGWRSLQRTRLCEIGRDNSDEVDAGFSKIVQFPNAMVQEEIRQSGLMKRPVSVTEHAQYKYVINVDGDAAGGTDLFDQLYSGAVVLKVQSASGFAQWYYDRLRPSVNYVPVASDLSDLLENLAWLKAHDEAAQRIAENGRALADSLVYDPELKGSVRTLAAALRYFSKRPGFSLTVGQGALPSGLFGTGWGAPGDAAVPADGFSSVLELPVPPLREDLVLSLELALNEEMTLPPQRLSLVVAGDLLSTSTLLERTTLKVKLPSQLLRNAAEGRDHFPIVLYHPDARPAASRDRPADPRQLSIVLQGITLAAASIAAAAFSKPIAAPRAAEPVIPTLDDAVPTLKVVAPAFKRPNPAFGIQVAPGPRAKFFSVKTYRETVVFAHPVSGLLWHGPLEGSARNLMLIKQGDQAMLLYRDADGSFYKTLIMPETPRTEKAHYGFRNASVVDRFSIVGAGPAVLGLSNQDLYLCAEADGRVTLSRTLLTQWEEFSLIPLN